MTTNDGVTSTVCGCDIFIDTTDNPADVATQLQALCESTPFKLSVISNRGTQVWPTGSPYTEIVNQCCVRFELENGATTDQGATIELLAKIAAKFTITEFIPIKMFDGKPGFSLAQGQ